MAFVSQPGCSVQYRPHYILLFYDQRNDDVDDDDDIAYLYCAFNESLLNSAMML